MLTAAPPAGIQLVGAVPFTATPRADRLVDEEPWASLPCHRRLPRLPPSPPRPQPGERGVPISQESACGRRSRAWSGTSLSSIAPRHRTLAGQTGSSVSTSWAAELVRFVGRGGQFLGLAEFQNSAGQRLAKPPSRSRDTHPILNPKPNGQGPQRSRSPMAKVPKVPNVLPLQGSLHRPVCFPFGILGGYAVDENPPWCMKMVSH